jgi:hypothetical protein
MATTDKPVILIVGGAFHVPKSYQILTSALESAGYEVVSYKILSLSFTPMLPESLTVRDRFA